MCVGGRRHRRAGRGTGGETLRLERACPGQENASDARSRVGGSATLPRAGISDGRAFLIEAFITFLLVFVIISVATDKRVSAAVAAPAIGFALVAAVLIGGGSTGGAVNPDRALGPAIMSATFTSLWVYILAPLVGGIAAAVLYDQVIGRADAPTPDDASDTAQD